MVSAKFETHRLKEKFSGFSQRRHIIYKGLKLLFNVNNGAEFDYSKMKYR